ncbi:MAG: MarR family transcriptional regulator [Gemmatimonadales bacterium]
MAKSSASSALQKELKQSKPFRSVGHEASVGLLRTADVVRRRWTETLAPFGITVPQYNVLRILRGAGKEGLCTLELAERLIERAPGITRMLDRLEARSWVRRERSVDDRREVRCYLTTQGMRLLARTDEVADQADQAAVLGLSKAEGRELIQLLDKVRSGLA